MQNKKQKIIEEQDPILTFKCLFYPIYTPLCSSEQFLLKYDALFEELKKLDSMPQQQVRKIKVPLKYFNLKKEQTIQQNQRLIFFVIQELNNLCTYCHRKQLRIKIIEQLSKYTKNLKNLAIGKKPIKFSKWQQKYYQDLNFDDLTETMKTSITQIFDRIFIEHQTIPNYYILFASKPETLINLFKFQSRIIYDLKSDKTSMPITHKYYLAVIAASTFGSRYLWNFTVKQFIKVGGDQNWIKNGIQQVPKYIQKFSQISYQMAYNFKVNTIQSICYQLGILVEDASILQGFYILSYFQFLACVSLVFGLNTQSEQFEVYLPDIPFISPSLDSFQTMKKVSKKQLVYQKQVAKQFEEMYSWQKDSEKQNFKKVQILKFQKSKSENKRNFQKILQSLTQDGQFDEPIPLLKEYKESSENQLMVTLQEEQIVQKVKNSRTMKTIQKVYSKYVPFGQRLSNVELKLSRKSENNTKSSEFSQNQQERNSSQKQSQYGFIYASEWNFEQQSGTLMQSVMDSTFYISIKQLLKNLRFMNKQKSKNLKIYYESLHNYMYEYISYINLINEGLSLIEKNYIKLLTRSPFLFNDKSFTKMKQDLQIYCEIKNPLNFCLQIFSFKLEHSMSLASYVYDRYLQNRQ